MKTFLLRLLRASQWGATLVLAGCNPQVDGGGGDDGSLVDEQGNDLEATPETTCEGPIYDDGFGYHGQCCYEVHCAAPEDGVCADPDAAKLTGLPPGSGECECGTRSGPYLNNDASSDDACCYLVGSIGCDGRPLLIEGAPRLADVTTAASAWSASPAGGPAALAQVDVAGLDPEVRATLARRWADRARFEHASVASFARFSMALLACGAPPDLVTASHQAALDEVRHARIALALSSAYAGRLQGFGPLDVGGAMDGPMTLEAVTLATVVEGCVGETLAAIEVAACAAAATAPAVREALSAIAEDETRHAELAWAFVRWAIGEGGQALRSRVAAAFEQAFAQARSHEPSGDPAGAPDHGFLPDSEVQSLRRQAITSVLRPAARALLGGRPRDGQSLQASA